MTSSKATEIDPVALVKLEESVALVRHASTAGAGLRIALACGSFNGGISQRLAEGAVAALIDCGVDRADITITWVPGAFELPFAAKRLIESGTVDAVVALGAVIRGDTGHYDFVAGGCADGLQRVQLDLGKPVIFGVLTTDTVDQALERSEPGTANKGYEAAMGAIEMARLSESLV